MFSRLTPNGKSLFLFVLTLFALHLFSSSAVLPIPEEVIAKAKPNSEMVDLEELLCIHASLQV
jgi:hypothetical protein